MNSPTLFEGLPIPAEAQQRDEWYTPKAIIEAARVTMGSIDLDPASCEAANEVVKAGRYFTAVDDGLRRPWQGNVWCNPPFSNGQIRFWIERCVDHDSPTCVIVPHTDAEQSRLILNLAECICWVLRSVNSGWYGPAKTDAMRRNKTSPWGFSPMMVGMFKCSPIGGEWDEIGPLR